LGGLDPLPLNRYLMQIEIPDAAWKARTQFDVALHVGWDALPAGPRVARLGHDLGKIGSAIDRAGAIHRRP